MATHSSVLAWRIPWTEKPGRLQSMRSLRVRHDWATSLSLSCIGEGNGNPLRCSCLENPRDGGAWWETVYGVTQSRTRLKRVSSSSSSNKVAMAVSALELEFHQQFDDTLESNRRPVFLGKGSPFMDFRVFQSVHCDTWKEEKGVFQLFLHWQIWSNIRDVTRAWMGLWALPLLQSSKGT